MVKVTRKCYSCDGTGQIEVKGPDYWLTPEGRKELRDSFAGDPGNCVLPLLDALEAAEDRLWALSGAGGPQGHE